mmetsp:Transcript_87420/g.245395  ORF Transcript_87420/g.245395 Transcript_87420/m.245395 type:complete len:487 (+) Transcript_87420:127-1587(+)
MRPMREMASVVFVAAQFELIVDSETSLCDHTLAAKLAVVDRLRLRFWRCLLACLEQTFGNGVGLGGCVHLETAVVHKMFSGGRVHPKMINKVVTGGPVGLREAVISEVVIVGRIFVESAVVGETIWGLHVCLQNAVCACVVHCVRISLHAFVGDGAALGRHVCPRDATGNGVGPGRRVNAADAMGVDVAPRGRVRLEYPVVADLGLGVCIYPVEAMAANGMNGSQNCFDNAAVGGVALGSCVRLWEGACHGVVCSERLRLNGATSKDVVCGAHVRRRWAADGDKTWSTCTCIAETGGSGVATGKGVRLDETMGDRVCLVRHLPDQGPGAPSNVNDFARGVAENCASARASSAGNNTSARDFITNFGKSGTRSGDFCFDVASLSSRLAVPHVCGYRFRLPPQLARTPAARVLFQDQPFLLGPRRLPSSRLPGHDGCRLRDATLSVDRDRRGTAMDRNASRQEVVACGVPSGPENQKNLGDKHTHLSL